MFKKLCCLIIIFSFLYSDIAYPLSNRSLFQGEDKGVSQFASVLASVISYLRDNPTADIQKIEGKFNVKINKDGSGVWLDSENWKMRFCKKDKEDSLKLADGDELIYKDDINGSLRVEVYSKGLNDRDKEAIREFMVRNPDISCLSKMVFEIIAGEENETLSNFIDSKPHAPIDELVEAVIKEMNIDVDDKAKDAIRDYVSVFKRRTELRTRREEILKDKSIFIFKKLSELRDEEIYGAVKKFLEDMIGKGNRLKIVSPNVFARILTRPKGLKENVADPNTTISATWGDTIYFSSNARLSDLVIYILHEVVHLYGGNEFDARRMQKEIISVLKGMVSFLRKMKLARSDLAMARSDLANLAIARSDIAKAIADVMEYEVLRYELDFHTARLETSPSGGVFLRCFHLAGINIISQDRSYIRGMKARVRRIIREGKDADLFSEIEGIIKTAEPEEIGVKLFWAFMEYMKRGVQKIAEEKEEFLQEEPETLPFYEKVLSYMIKKEEADRRLRDVVLNKDAPLFARINEAIMIVMFAETEDVALNAVDKIKNLIDESNEVSGEQTLKDLVKALEILEEFRNKKAVELISGFLSHNNPNIRAIAAEKLFNIVGALAPNVIFNSPVTKENLLTFVNKPKIGIKDPELIAVYQIIRVLSSIRCKEAEPVFLSIIKENENKSIRKFVARELGSIGDTSIIPKVRDMIWKSGDTVSMEVSVSCLEKVPNDESAEIIINTFMKTKNQALRSYCLKALETVIRKRRISSDFMMPIVADLMKIIIGNESVEGLNFILGRVLSISLQEGKLNLFNEIETKTIKSWLGYIKKNPEALADFSKGLIHDTFMDIEELKNVNKDNLLKGVFDLILKNQIGKWIDLIEYAQKMKKDIYIGRREYKDNIWKKIADQLKKVKPEDEMPIGKEWFQRMCLGIAYRALLDTWDIGRIEDRDFILELMILRSSFVAEGLPKGAIGATEAIHGDYVELDNSLFSNPACIPIGVDTVWHEGTHLLTGMGIADIGDISLLGASSHSGIEFYLLSEIFGLPSINYVVDRVKKGEPVNNILKNYKDKGMPEENLGSIGTILKGMAIKDKAKGPLEAFFIVRNIEPESYRDSRWEDVLWKLQQINNEIIHAFTLRGKLQMLVNTYFDGTLFSGYAQRLGVETDFYDATNIYVENIVRYRLSPSQAEFIARTIAKFMTEARNMIDSMGKELSVKCKGASEGKINKWLNRYVIEKLKELCLKQRGEVEMWVTYENLNKLADKTFIGIKDEMAKTDVKEEIYNKVIKGISTNTEIFKAIRPGAAGDGDYSGHLPEALMEKLKENRSVNEGVRKFINSLINGNLLTDKGDEFLIGDFNRLLRVCGRGEFTDFFEREFEMDTRVSSKIINYAFGMLEYKKEIDIRDLERMADMENILNAIAYRNFEYEEKKIGLIEFFEFAREDINKLYEVLKKSHEAGKEKVLTEDIAEKTADIIFNVYLSLKKEEGLKEFKEKIVQVDIFNYISPPTERHRLIREFKIKGDEFITADERKFDAVMDSMGVSQGLKYMERIKVTTEDGNLSCALTEYLGSFEIGPSGYIPVEIEDAWRSFALWKERVGEVSYEDAQRKLLELYIRYIWDVKGKMPRWGWIFLWLFYFEKGTRMYNAVCELLKEVSLGKPVDINSLIEDISKRHKLNNGEKGMLLYAAPIDEFINLVQIYCKNITWGEQGLEELEERLKKDMNVVTKEDVGSKDLFNEDVCGWFHTFKNMPSELEGAIKEKLKNEIVELVLNRLSESRLVSETDKIREELNKILNLIYLVRFPASGERFIDSVSIIDLRKILFNYARNMIADDKPVADIHLKKNIEISAGRLQYKEINEKRYILFLATDASFEESSCESYENEFYNELKSAKKLLIFTHKHTETVGLLYWIQKIMEENPSLKVRIMPQKSLWELNSTMEDIENILKEEEKLPAEEKSLQRFVDYKEKGRLVLLSDCSPGLSWLKGPKRAEVKKEIKESDIVLGVGWDNFVSLQGLERTSYFIFSIDDPIKEKFTGCKKGEFIFTKTCGGLPAIKTGEYTLNDYLTCTNGSIYKRLLSFFKGDRNREKLHVWIRQEAKRTKKKEIDVIRSKIYYERPAKVFGKCALREADSDSRIQALNILLDNYEQFGIKKETANLVRLDNVEIRAGAQVDCYYNPNRTAAVLVKDGKRLVLEKLKGEGEDVYLRIGDKGYKVEGAVNLYRLMKEPILWVGNSELVEFFGAENISKFKENERGPPGVSIRNIPQYINNQIPQTKPNYIYKIAEEFLANPVSYIPLELHYIVVLLSSSNISQKVRGLERLERLIMYSDKEILNIIQIIGLSRVRDWIKQEVPLDSDISILANFTPEQERILKALSGGYLLRPPLVIMPGQGISTGFYDLVCEEVFKFDIDLLRGNYAEGAGNVLFPDGRRCYIKAGDLLLELSRNLLNGQMLGAIRLKDDDGDIIQVPGNASILNYLKVIHHLGHIIAERFITARGGKIDLLQEFTPAIDDAIAIKFMERLAGELKDGFRDFRKEVFMMRYEDGLRKVFSKYGLDFPVNKKFKEIRQEILEIKYMPEFSIYIERNNLGSFLSVKEFLNILIDYTKTTIKGHIKQLPPHQKIILEKLLIVKEDKEINNLLIIASQLAGCYIPKIDFDKEIEIVKGLLTRPGMAVMADKNKILGRINQVLEGGEPFSAKAVKIVGTVLYRMGIRVSREERRKIEEKVMDILNGNWLEEMETALREKIIDLEEEGIDTKNLRREIDGLKMTSAQQNLGEGELPEIEDEKIKPVNSWSEIIEYVKENRIKRVFFDIDKTIIDAPGLITTTPWFKEMVKRVGLPETIKKWSEYEDEMLKGKKMIQLMESCIPGVINSLKDMGAEVILYTARGKEDLERTEKMLKNAGIDIEGLEIIISKGGTPEQKRDALIGYYESKGWLDEDAIVPSLYMDDTRGNLKAVHGDSRFRQHIHCLWYRAPYKTKSDVDPKDFLADGDKALAEGNIIKALHSYYDACYVMTRKDIANRVYDIVSEDMGFSASMEEVFYRFIKDRLNRYKSALERESMWLKPPVEEKPEKKEVKWFEPAPDFPSLEGIKTVVVVLGHPHGDHTNGALDYAKGKMKNLFETPVPDSDQMKTGGPITHSLSNYWGRIGEETIVLFDLGWFPEGFVDPLIQTINPRDREILFIMDPRTEKTLDFKRKLKGLDPERVKLNTIPYGELVNIPIEKGRILQIENYPAYHLAPSVGSSAYMVRMLDANTNKVIQNIGYISELGDVFPKTVNDEFLEKQARLDRMIVDGTNLFAPMGEEPLPLEGRENKVDEHMKRLNCGEFLISHLNTQSIRMGEEAEIADQNLAPGIPIVIIGGKDAIEQLRRIYDVPKGQDYFSTEKRKVYLVNDVAGFHKRLRENGGLPKLEDVLNERIGGLRKAGWGEEEIKEFVNEWEEADKQAVQEFKWPEGKVKELERLFWDLRKTKAVVISSSQFRGNPKEKMYKNFKGFQILDAIVDKKDVSILIEGRLHIKDKDGKILKDGEILNVLLGKGAGRWISTITGKKKVLATIDNQWRSGHITFESLMDLLNKVADKAVELGNVYNVRTFMPVPQDEWLNVIPKEEVEILLQRHGQNSLEDVKNIIERWNKRKDVKVEEIHFVKEVFKEIFKSADLWGTYFEDNNVVDLRKALLNRLNRIEHEARLQGKVNIRIFFASTSRFIDVLRRGGTEQLKIAPEKLSQLFKTAERFIGFEVGVSHKYGKTIDLVQRKIEEYSINLGEVFNNRNYLNKLFLQTIKDKATPDFSRWLEKKDLKGYKDKIGEILKQAEKKEWVGELKKYIESQYLRMGLRYIKKTAPYSELREELSWLYDAVIEFVFNSIQEDMGQKYKDITIIAGGDYAQFKALFKDTINLGILSGDDVDKEYADQLCKDMRDKLNKLGISVEFSDWKQFIHRRIVAGGFADAEERLKEEVSRDLLINREGRIGEDLKMLKAKTGFDIHKGPGGLDDIELIRHFFSLELTGNQERMINDAEEFLRRYKDEVGLSTGGDKNKTRELFSEISSNLGFSTIGDFKYVFYEKIWCAYMVLVNKTGIPDQKAVKGAAKNISFGNIDEQKNIHEGVFEKAEGEGRLFREGMKTNDERVKQGFRLIKKIKRENSVLRNRIFKIIVEEGDRPTMFYCEEPFTSVLSHSGKSKNTIYIGLETLKLVREKPEHRKAFKNLLLHENRDIERGYHMDLEDEVREGFITHEDVDGIYKLWNDLITDGRFSIMYNLYMKRAGKKKYWEFFLERIPADIRIMKGENLCEFEHGDIMGLPDFIGLNLKLLSKEFSPAAQVFLLRHCTDKIRYDRYKTAINDIRYLLKISKKEREVILKELDELKYIKFLRRNLTLDRENISEYTGLKFEAYNSKDGAEVKYSAGGNKNAKRTLVFLHGMGVNSGDWCHQITVFEGEYRIIAIDLRGFGKSEGLGKNPPGIRNYAKDVEGVLQKEGITDAILVCHSMGGMVALNMDELYADIPLEKRRIKGLVLIATDAGNPMRRFSKVIRKIILKFIRSKQFEMIWESPILKWLIRRDALAPVIRGIPELLGITQRETHPLFTKKVVLSVFKTKKESLEYAIKSWDTHNVENNLCNLKIPVLWFIGEKDGATPAQEQKRQASLIRDCKVVVIPDAKHYLHATFPRRVNQEINGFLNEGAYRFSQLVCEKIKEKFKIEVSLDGLETDIKSLKIRLIPRLKNIQDGDLRLIDEISEIVMTCGWETGVSNETMIKAVIILASQIIPKKRIAIPSAGPVPLEDIENLYNSIVQSV